MAVRNENAVHGFERAVPVDVLHDRLNGVAGARHDIDMQLARNRRRVAMDPADSAGPGLRPRDIEHRPRRIDGHDSETGRGEHDRERARAAPEVEDTGGAELRDDRRVDVEVAPADAWYSPQARVHSMRLARPSHPAM